MTSSLRELRLGGHDLPELPACIRHLRGLTHLSLAGWFGLKALPGWLAELPLQILDIVNSGVESLSMFHANTTLRCVVAFYSPLALEWDDYWEEMFSEESIDVVERELVPLSTAQPQIRFQLLNEEARPTPSDCTFPEWDGWWHAGFRTADGGLDLQAANQSKLLSLQEDSSEDS
jgi:hypothetical protein